jgi:hypothetical protein
MAMSAAVCGEAVRGRNSIGGGMAEGKPAPMTGPLMPGTETPRAAPVSLFMSSRPSLSEFVQ